MFCRQKISRFSTNDDSIFMVTNIIVCDFCFDVRAGVRQRHLFGVGGKVVSNEIYRRGSGFAVDQRNCGPLVVFIL